MTSSNDVVKNTMIKMMKHKLSYNIPVAAELAMHCNMYIIYPGIDSTSAIYHHNDCKWWDIMHRGEPSSIRVFSIQDYSILFRRLICSFIRQFPRYKDIYHSAFVYKYTAACISIIMFVNTYLRPVMIKNGLIGHRRYWRYGMVSLPLIENQIEPSYDEWFKGQVMVGVGMKDLYFPTTTTSTCTLIEIYKSFGHVAWLWYIHNGGNVEFPKYIDDDDEKVITYVKDAKNVNGASDVNVQDIDENGKVGEDGEEGDEKGNEKDDDDADEKDEKGNDNDDDYCEGDDYDEDEEREEELKEEEEKLVCTTVKKETDIQIEMTDITRVILKQVVMNHHGTMLYPLGSAATANLYVILPGTTKEVASIQYGDCKWFDIMYHQKPSSIRIYSLQDYSIMFRYHQTIFVKDQRYHKDPFNKWYKSCIAIITFAHKYLRPEMIQRGLVGRRSGWMKQIVLQHQDEPEYKSWFSNNQQSCFLPLVKRNNLHRLPAIIDTTIMQLNYYLALIMSTWAIQLGNKFDHHPEFPVLSHDFVF